MVIKVYTSGISGNKEVKKKQQRIMMILESKNISYVTIDITEPGNEEEKYYMQETAKPKESSKHPIPPQIFNETEYCGDYEGFDVANENDELEIFLKMPLPPPPVVNGKHEHSTEKDTSDSQVPERQEELINSMVPDTTIQEPDQEIEENVHGFCYTPGLAKRLEKALKNRIRKKPTVHGYCYTPSLAQRLAKALEKALTRKHPGIQPSMRSSGRFSLLLSNVEDEKIKEDQEDETESLANDEEMEADDDVEKVDNNEDSEEDIADEE